MASGAGDSSKATQVDKAQCCAGGERAGKSRASALVWPIGGRRGASFGVGAAGSREPTTSLLCGTGTGATATWMQGWREALQALDLKPRPTQERALASVEGGADLVLIDRTGGGKSLAFQLPAALAWRAGALGDELPPPITLVVVPFIALGEDQRERAEAFLTRLHEVGILPRRAAALFVQRGDGAAAKPKPAVEVAATHIGWPTALPCGVCIGCRRDAVPSVLGRLPKVPGVGGSRPCCWTCRVTAPDDDSLWCGWCRNHGTGNAVRNGKGECGPRAALLGKAAVAPLPVATPRTRSGAAVGGPTADGEVEAKQGEPKRLGELPPSAPERLIVEDSDVAVVVVTSSALAGEGARARLLREAVATRRVAVVAIDECDTIGEHQLAGLNPALARLGTILDQRDAAAPAQWPRPPRLALSGTLPPVARSHVLRRLRLDPEAGVVCGSIDRTDISYYRVPLQWRVGEGVVAAGVRAFELVRAGLPRRSGSERAEQ